jgi:hypothetical protein
MSLDNQISISLTEQEITDLKAAFTSIETILAGKTIALTPDQRKEYGRLGKLFAPWAEKVKMYMDERPDLVPMFIDTTETAKDFTVRGQLTEFHNRSETIYVGVDDTLTLIGSDIYYMALAYYKNLKVLAEQNVPGAKPIFDDLSATYPGRK